MRFNVCFHPPAEGHIDWDEISRVLEGFHIVAQLPPLRIFTIEAKKSDIQALLNQPSVKSIEEDIRMKPDATQTYAISNDPMVSQQWALKRMRVHEAHSLQAGLPTVIVAVIDSGLYETHEEFINRGIIGYGVDANAPVFSPSTPHGTECASCITPATGNNAGIAGVAPGVTLMPIRAESVVGGETDFFIAGVATAILDAQAYGADIISFSLGMEAHNETITSAINFVTGEGVLFISSSGNDGETTGIVGHPQGDNIYKVGAIDINNKRASFSSHIGPVSIVAPGENILVATNPATTGATPGYKLINGTSFSCPHVAAVAALVKSENPTLTASDIMDVILSTASPVDDPEYPDIGCPDAYHAVIKARALAYPLVVQTHLQFLGEGIATRYTASEMILDVPQHAQADIKVYNGDKAILYQHGQYAYMGPPEGVTPNIIHNPYGHVTDIGPT